jgi:hypothetical protein
MYMLDCIECIDQMYIESFQLEMMMMTKELFCRIQRDDNDLSLHQNQMNNIEVVHDIENDIALNSWCCICLIDRVSHSMVEIQNQTERYQSLFYIFENKLIIKKKKYLLYSYLFICH